MAIDPENVCVIVPTRGDVDLKEIIDSLEEACFGEIVIWNNGNHQVQTPSGLLADDVPDLKVYGRYAAIEYVKQPVIATQDDDVIVPWEDILPHYAPGRLLANMDKDRWGKNWGYPDSTLVGWGAVFARVLPEVAFKKFWGESFEEQIVRHMSMAIDEPATAESRTPPIFPPPPPPASFLRTCDVIFSSLTPRTIIDVGYRHLPWAAGPGRMWTSGPGHSQERNEVLNLCRAIRTWPDDDIRIGG